MSARFPATTPATFHRRRRLASENDAAVTVSGISTTSPLGHCHHVTQLTHPSVTKTITGTLQRSAECFGLVLVLKTLASLAQHGAPAAGRHSAHTCPVHRGPDRPAPITHLTTSTAPRQDLGMSGGVCRPHSIESHRRAGVPTPSQGRSHPSGEPPGRIAHSYS